MLLPPNFSAELQEIARKIKAGGVGIFPHDTILGLIGRMDLGVIKRIGELKGRPEGKPFLVLVPDTSFLVGLTSHIPEIAQPYIAKHWPGALTIILPKAASLDAQYTAGKDTIGIRYPDFAPLNYLLELMQEPLISTSVNLAGQSSALEFADIDSKLRNAVDFCFDKVSPELKQESSILDCSGEAPIILRQGAVALC